MPTLEEVQGLEVSEGSLTELGLSAGAIAAESAIGNAIGTSLARTVLGRFNAISNMGIAYFDARKSFKYDQNADGWGAVAGGVGGMGGVAVGALIGSGVPVVGTIIGGIAGYFGAKWLGKKGALAAGIDNKYEGILSLEKLEGQFGKEEYPLLVAMMQDKGFAIVNDSDSKMATEKDSNLLAQSYADFNEEVSMDALRVNMQYLSVKEGKIKDERFAEYRKRFEKQIDGLVVAGEFQGLQDAEGNTLDEKEIKNYLMDRVLRANNVKEGQNRKELFDEPLEVIGRLEFMNKLSEIDGPVTDEQLIKIYNKEYKMILREQAAPLTPEELMELKIDVLEQRPEIQFAVMPGDLQSQVQGQGAGISSPDEEKSLLETIWDKVKEILLSIPVVGDLLKNMDLFKDEKPRVPVAGTIPVARGANGRGEEIGEIGDDLREEVVALGGGIRDAANRGEELRDDGATPPLNGKPIERS